MKSGRKSTGAIAAGIGDRALLRREGRLAAGAASEAAVGTEVGVGGEVRAGAESGRRAKAGDGVVLGGPAGAGVTEKVQAGVEGKVQEEAGAKHRSKVGG